jgi:hypothetical protein
MSTSNLKASTNGNRFCQLKSLSSETDPSFVEVSPSAAPGAWRRLEEETKINALDQSDWSRRNVMLAELRSAAVDHDDMEADSNMTTCRLHVTS